MNLKQFKKELLKDSKFKAEYNKDCIELDLMEIRIKYGLTKTKFKNILKKIYFKTNDNRNP